MPLHIRVEHVGDRLQVSAHDRFEAASGDVGVGLGHGPSISGAQTGSFARTFASSGLSLSPLADGSSMPLPANSATANGFVVGRRYGASAVDSVRRSRCPAAIRFDNPNASKSTSCNGFAVEPSNGSEYAPRVSSFALPSGAMSYSFGSSWNAASEVVGAPLGSTALDASCSFRRGMPAMSSPFGSGARDAGGGSGGGSPAMSSPFGSGALS